MLSEDDFYSIRDQYLTAARPIQSPAHLKGRKKSLSALVDALRSSGRHAFIYGYRGVGKSSLAQTTAIEVAGVDRETILTSCEDASSFESIIRDIVRKAFREPEKRPWLPRKFSAGANVAGYAGANVAWENTDPESGDLEIKSVSEAHDYLQRAAARLKKRLVVVIDEFDQLTSDACHIKFARLVKQASDQNSPITIIFCGIANSIESLFKAHDSISRSMHAEEVERLPLGARIEIIEDASKALKIKMPSGFVYRIAEISDGFPSFVHLIADKVFSTAFHGKLIEVDTKSYAAGLDIAVKSVEPSLRKRYEDALHRNTKKYEHVIWAAASDHNLDSNVETIWKHYRGIMHQLGEPEVKRQAVAAKLSHLASEKYGRILTKLRHANYSFSEKMMRGYARLRAENAGVRTGKENPDMVRL